MSRCLPDRASLVDGPVTVPKTARHAHSPPHHAERPKVAAFRRWILDAAQADGAA